MVSRADFKKGEKHWATTYADPNNSDEVTEVRFFTKEENDSYAAGVKLMGVTSIVKSFYNPAMRSWHTYSNTVDVNALNRQALSRMYPD